jgi:hypothetical protein
MCILRLAIGWNERHPSRERAKRRQQVAGLDWD